MSAFKIKKIGLFVLLFTLINIFFASKILADENWYYTTDGAIGSTARVVHEGFKSKQACLDDLKSVHPSWHPSECLLSRTGIIGTTIRSSSKSIASFKFNALTPAVSGDINNLSISLVVPAGTDVTSLVPTIGLSDAKAVVVPASLVAQNFTSPVIYKVTAEDDSTELYTVTVKIDKGGEKVWFFNMVGNNITQHVGPDTETACENTRENMVKNAGSNLNKTIFVDSKCYDNSKFSPTCISPETLSTGTNTCVCRAPACTCKAGKKLNPETETCETDKTYVENKTYTLLAPLPGMQQTFDTQQTDTNCPFGNYMNIIFELAIGLAGVMAVIMIVWGGIQYMTTELISSKEAAKSTITNALLGLLMMLGTWALLNTLNPALLKVCFGMKNQTVTIEKDVAQTPFNNQYTCKSGQYANNSQWTGTPLAVKDASGKIVVKDAQGKVLANVNKDDCNTVGQHDCTSTKGLLPDIVSSIRTLCSDCELTITGGTECWLHSATGSHHPNSPTVDLSSNGTPKLNTYITGKASVTMDGTVYQKNGINFLAESLEQTGNTTAAHWHVYK